MPGGGGSYRGRKNKGIVRKGTPSEVAPVGPNQGGHIPVLVDWEGSVDHGNQDLGSRERGGGGYHIGVGATVSDRKKTAGSGST